MASDRMPSLVSSRRPSGRLYFVAAILTNLKTCAMASYPFDGRGNGIASYFGLTPPSMHDYLHG